MKKEILITKKENAVLEELKRIATENKASERLTDFFRQAMSYEEIRMNTTTEEATTINILIDFLQDVEKLPYYEE